MDDKHISTSNVLQYGVPMSLLGRISNIANLGSFVNVTLLIQVRLDVDGGHGCIEVFINLQCELNSGDSVYDVLVP